MTFASVGTSVTQNTCGVRGQLLGVVSLLPPCWFWRQHLDHQGCACSSPWAVCALGLQHLPLPWPIHTASNQLLNECVIKHRVWQSIQLKDLLGRFLCTTLPSTHFPLLKSERILNLALTQTQPASTCPHWQLSELTRSGLMWGAPHSWPGSSSVDP